MVYRPFGSFLFHLCSVRSYMIDKCFIVISNLIKFHATHSILYISSSLTTNNLASTSSTKLSFDDLINGVPLIAAEAFIPSIILTVLTVTILYARQSFRDILVETKSSFFELLRHLQV